LPFIRAWEGIKINKIIEEALTNMIRRIEVLENNSKNTVKDTVKPTVKKGYVSGMATEGQLKYIGILGGESWEEMTKSEAGQEIDRLILKKQRSVAREIPGPTADTPERVHEQIAEGTYNEKKPLTEEEIAELGEDAFL